MSENSSYKVQSQAFGSGEWTDLRWEDGDREVRVFRSYAEADYAMLSAHRASAPGTHFRAVSL